MIKKLPLVLFLVLALLSANARGDYKFSESDKAVFAFFKLNKGTPAYETWVGANPRYVNEADAKRQREFYEQEILRLKWGFGTFDPASDFLRLKTDIILQLSHKNDLPVLNFKFADSAREEIPYFPYAYGNEWIAFILNDLGNFTTVTLKDGEYNNIRQHMQEGPLYKAKLALQARAISADSKATVRMDGVDQWLMLGDTGYLEFIYPDPETGEQHKLWSYTAPWFLTETEKLLLPLVE